MSAFRRASFVFALILVSAVFGSPAEAAKPAALKLQLTVPFAPQRVLSDKWQNVAYEIDISRDYRALGYALKRVEVLDPAGKMKIVRAYEGQTLAANMLLPDKYKEIKIPMVLVWLKFDHSGTVPKSLIHRFYFQRVSDGRAVTMTGAGTRVDFSPVRVIASPMKGKLIALFETTDEKVHHFRLPVMDGKRTKNPQRYAADWMILTQDGKLRKEPGETNEDYPIWKADLLAVADGTVVDARDGMDDWVGWFTDTGRVKPADVTGNHVYLDIGQGHYAVYAHCMKGSVVVKKGDKVRTGQVVCKAGNTGVSNAPHLHFQISNGPDPLAAESVPYVFDKFVVTGNAARAWQVDGASYEPLAVPRVVKERIPDCFDVITFE
ncbi:MAG TPA: M23 family metallopeptidase [Syntrophales bacterium]|nr:M23 family metallopeptidase [Syntrophales bacterium]